MPDQKKTESKYGIKFARRRAMDGGRENPMPRPLDPYFIPKSGGVDRFGFKQGPGSFEPHKREDQKMILRFRNRAFVYPKLSEKTLRMNGQRIVKYDHYAMNYHGWDQSLR